MKQDEIHAWKVIGEETVAEGHFLKYKRSHRIEDGTGRKATFDIIETTDWVNIIAITDKRELVLIEQFRHGTQEIELEIPGGMVDEGEDAATAVLRELLEETGYGPSPTSEFRKLGVVRPNPAFLTNYCSLYLLTNAIAAGDTKFDEHENIRVVLEPVERMDDLVRVGRIIHPLMLTSFYLYHLQKTSSEADSSTTFQH